MTTNTNTPRPTHFIVQSAHTHMPNSCWGRYCRVAVLEVEQGLDSVAMISDHARGCVRVVATWEKCHVGKTERDAASRAHRAAVEMAAELNAKAEALRAFVEAHSAGTMACLVGEGE